MFAVCRRRDDGRVPRAFRAAAVVWLPARSDMKRRRWPGRAVHHYPVVVGQVRPPALGGVIGLSVTFLSGEHLASVVLTKDGCTGQARRADNSGCVQAGPRTRRAGCARLYATRIRKIGPPSEEAADSEHRVNQRLKWRFLAGPSVTRSRTRVSTEPTKDRTLPRRWALHVARRVSSR